MTWLKKVLLLIGILLLTVIGLLYIFNYDYILKGVRTVYLTGHKTVYIDDAVHFENHTIKKGVVQEWDLHKEYNKAKPTEDLLKMNQRLGTTSFLIIKNDSIFYENYEEEFRKESLTNSFSMAKSIVTAMLFKAIDQGHIESLDTKVISILPELKGEYAKEVTVGDLSSMSSGLNWNENYTSPFSVTAEAYYVKEIRELILDLEISEKPGQSYKYLSGATQLLGIAIEKAIKQNLSDYLSSNFWQPMGMKNDALWQIDSKDSGMEKTYCCIASNARDFGRFGKLWSDNGAWNGKQLIPENLAKLAKEPRFKNSPEYGYGLWLNNYRNKKISYMRGILGQYVISIPEDNIIIVRLGHSRDNPNKNQSIGNDFNVYIDAAYEMLAQFSE